MNLVEKEFIGFMKKFDAFPFQMVINGESYLAGEGAPEFTVVFHKVPNVTELMKSTSIALGEAYMQGDIEIEGDLYDALYHFMGQIGGFSTDKKALKKLIFTSNSKKIKGKRFLPIMISEMIFISCGLTKL